VGLWLNVLVISALLRGSYREYRLVFVYAVTLLLSTVVEIAAPQSLRNRYYWIDEFVLVFLVYCVVISFIDQARRTASRKLIERWWLVGFAAVIVVLSVGLHQDPYVDRRLTLVSRDLNICAVVFDLILWSALATSRQPDRRLMLLSGGLGLQLTGAIMGEQLRNLSKSTVGPGTLLEILSGFAGLYIWWRGLRPVREREGSVARLSAGSLGRKRPGG
jgi:hypothetical protein